MKPNKPTYTQWLLLKSMDDGEHVFRFEVTRGPVSWATPKGTTGNDALVCLRNGWIEEDPSRRGKYGGPPWYKLSALGMEILKQTAPEGPQEFTLYRYKPGYAESMCTCRAVLKKSGDYWDVRGWRLKEPWFRNKLAALKDALRLKENEIDYAKKEVAKILEMLKKEEDESGQAEGQDSRA